MTERTNILQLPPLLSEAEAVEQYGAFLEDKELRRARQERVLGYYKLKGKILYREDELADYIKAKLEGRYTKPCQINSGSGDTGSTTSKDRGTSTGSGMTPELERSGAALLRQQTSKKPRSSSRQSSSKRGKLRLVTPERSRS